MGGRVRKRDGSTGREAASAEPRCLRHPRTRPVETARHPRTRPVETVGMMADLLGRTSEVVAAVKRLRAESVNGPLTALARVLPSLGSSDEDVAEILTRHPLQSLADPVARLVHATAAARLDRRDEAIEGLWGLITVGRASAWSRRLYARLAVERNAPGDAQRATTALAFLSSRPAAWDP